MRKLKNPFKEKTLLRVFKEELVWVPLILILFVIWNKVMFHYNPHSALFDPDSQFDTLFYGLVSVSMIFWVSHLIFRLTFPHIHKFFIDRFYFGFNGMTSEKKEDYSFKLFIIFVLCVTLLFCAVNGKSANPDDTRAKLKIMLDYQLSIHTDSKDRNPQVDKMLENVGIKPPNEWCAAFASYDLDSLGVDNPHSAWSPNFAKPKDIIWHHKNSKGNIEPKLGDCFTLYYASLGRVGHTGFFFEKDKSGWDITEAGNTAGPTSRHGDRVGRHKISRLKIYAYSRYIK